MKTRKIDKKSLDAITKLHQNNIKAAREKAVLKKHQDPTWIQMMDHIDLAFDNFQGIRGYWNILNDKWVVIMTDLSKAHELLRDAVDDIETVEFSSPSGYSWTEAQYNVAFEISNRCETVRVREDYHGERYIEELSPEKVEAIEYRIREEIMPKLKALIYDQYPYYDKPRVLTNIDNLDVEKINEMAKSERYASVGNGSFRYLVYRMKGMGPIENVIDFENWLLKED
jgi:hypothetical protein